MCISPSVLFRNSTRNLCSVLEQEGHKVPFRRVSASISVLCVRSDPNRWPHLVMRPVLVRHQTGNGLRPANKIRMIGIDISLLDLYQIPDHIVSGCQ